VAAVLTTVRIKRQRNPARAVRKTETTTKEGRGSMTGEQIVSLLSAVRSHGDNRWIACCPAHDDKSPSLTIKQTNHRVLIRCFAGCEIADICTAIRIQLKDLFLDSKRATNPAALRRHRAVEKLQDWQQAELQRVAEDLRTRDTILGAIRRMVNSGEISEDEAWDTIANAYDGYSELEYRFEQLLHNENIVELWRESRRTA
jgi:hypothetical protein